MRLHQFALLSAIELCLTGCDFYKFPRIDDPETLRKECVELKSEPVLKNVATNKWPPSIRALKPISVYRSTEDIEILLGWEGKKKTSGYLITFDPHKEPANLNFSIERTRYEGIYIFQVESGGMF